MVDMDLNHTMITEKNGFICTQVITITYLEEQPRHFWTKKSPEGNSKKQKQLQNSKLLVDC